MDAKVVENNDWIKFIGKTSYDVMWDLDIATGEFYVGDSMEEVFGYKMQGRKVTLEDFQNWLNPQEKETVLLKLRQSLASAKTSWEDEYNLVLTDGSLAAAVSRASIVRNEKGEAIRLIGATQNVSRMQELEKKVRELFTIHEKDSEKFLLAAKLSFDVLWEWNLLTDEIFIGTGFEKLFGYPVKDNKGVITDMLIHIYPDDKDKVVEGFKSFIESFAMQCQHSFRYIRADGSIATVFNRASIIRHPDGKAYRVINALQDLSLLGEFEAKLDHQILVRDKLHTEYEAGNKLIFNSSSDVLYDIDLVSNEIVINEAYEKEFGYKITGNMTVMNNWAVHIHPDDKVEVVQSYINSISSKEIEWKHSFRFLRQNGSIANVLSSAIILRNAVGIAYRIIGSMQDVSKQRVLEEKLEEEIHLKERQIAQAREEAKETERSDLGKELHDNVNQLLGASRLYIDMARHGGEDSEMYLSRSSEYTLMAIEEIRKLAKGMTSDIIINLGLTEAIKQITRDAMEVSPVKIRCVVNRFKERFVNDKFKLNVFRIVQEQLNNILKHAQASQVEIHLMQNNKFILLIISDNGVGFDTAKEHKGVGIANIRSRAANYNGKAVFDSKPGGSCVLTVTFPLSASVLN